jgi:hypothetical protein
MGWLSDTEMLEEEVDTNDIYTKFEPRITFITEMATVELPCIHLVLAFVIQ